jgi:hypothetical protein
MLLAAARLQAAGEGTAADAQGAVWRDAADQQLSGLPATAGRPM